MRILVTGGAGYIGGHVCKQLAQSGFEPIVYDNLSTGHRWAVKWGPLIEGDLADRPRLSEVFDRGQIDGVIHLAACAYVGESVTDPGKYYSNNYAGTLNLLDCMRNARVESLVFSSSCATYGIPAEIPIREEALQNPVNPYGESKWFVERTLLWYREAYGLRHVTLRYFNAAGADPDATLGEVHNPETHLIPLAIQAALGFRGPLQLFGNDYPTADGTAIRDYIHVTDLAEAHVLALQYLKTGSVSASMNLGNGAGHSVLDVIGAVERQAGRRVPVRVAPRRPGDPPALVADATRAHRVLGWRPAFSDLDRIVAHAVAWERKYQACHRQ